MQNPTLPGSARERGSAYIVALLALLVLTMGGLSVALITQTEMQVGMNEKTIQRAFYAAESGLNIATAYILTNGGRCYPQVGGIDRPEGWSLALDLNAMEDPTAPERFADVATVSPALILFKGCCNWCPCQENPDVGEIDRFNYGMVSDSQRLMWNNSAVTVAPGESYPDAGPGVGVLARRSVGTMIDIQPFAPSGNEQCLEIDAATLDRIKF
jgi:hypothetical protein